MIIFPIAVFLFVLMITKRRAVVENWREVFLFSSTITGRFTVFVVEILSLFHMLSWPGILVSWVALFLATMIFAWKRRIFSSPVHRPEPLKQNKENKKLKNKDFQNKTKVLFSGFPKTILFFLGVLAVFGGVTFIIAIVAPPNTWDSMTYHLARIMHWLDNRSVYFYEAANDRQNFYPPGAEYILLNIYALMNSDRCLNLLQWAAGMGSAAGVSLIAGYLGAGLLGQAFAGVLVFTIPMAILQSSSTQTDLIASFWIVTTLVFLMRSMRDIKPGSWCDIIAAGMAAGMAFLTKGTAFVILPFFLWFAVRSIQTEKIKGVFKSAMVLAIILMVIFPWVARCVQADKGKMGGISDVSLKDHSWQCLISNTSKHLASECEVPFLPIMKACAANVTGVHRFINFKLDDERTTGGDLREMLLSSQVFEEDHAGNFFHVLFFMVCAVTALFLKNWKARFYVICCFIAAAVFVSTVKWNPWVNRFHLPLLLITVPVAGVVVNNRKWIVWILSAIFLCLAVPVLLHNNSRPISGEKTIFSFPWSYQYFWKRPDLLEPYHNAAQIITKSGCRHVGINIGGDSWEYPFWALTKESRVRFSYLKIEDGKVNYKQDDDLPCLLLTEGSRGQNLIYDMKHHFRQIWNQNSVNIYLQEEFFKSDAKKL
ncbi:MAG: glycosyltransferase family 39 protein [Candidatus Omnitrophica bacterium]|nr:glycosyltransferase family 39 protein [Candidatus Omnitrophota bacterium]